MLTIITLACFLGASPASGPPSRPAPQTAGRLDARDPGLADAGRSTDTGLLDAGLLDAGLLDAGLLDARLLDARLDAGLLDAGQRDGGLTDAGRSLDAGLLDAGQRDGGLTDAGRPLDAGQRDGGVAEASRPLGGEAAFLLFPGALSAADGTVLPPATELSGAGASMLKYAAQQQTNRARELASGQRSLSAVTAGLDRFFQTSGGEDPRVQRDELARLAGSTLEQGRMAYQAAADHERRRLSWVVKAIGDAATNGEDNPLPDVDVVLVTARLATVRDGKVRAAIDARINGYRGLLLGIVAWVDGDTFRSLEQLKLGVAGAPDLPLAHLYLGYLHYILENVKDAMAEWRKAQDLDPANGTIKKLIADHIHELKLK